MSHREQKARQRERFIKNDPHCHFCGQEVVYFELKNHQTVPTNFAVIDRFEGKHILSCNKCNHDRHDELQKFCYEKSKWQVFTRKIKTYLWKPIIFLRIHRLKHIFKTK